MRQALRWGMLASALAMPVPSSVRADEGAAEREAQARFEEGVSRVKKGNFEGARVSFTQAYAVLRKPYILWNLALAEEKTGHVLDALGHFKDFARGRQNADDRARAERHVGELMGQTGHVAVVAPDGSQVIVDGASAGTAPLAEAVDVMPGRHHIEALALQTTTEGDVEVVAGQVVHLRLMLATASAQTLPPAAVAAVVPDAGSATNMSPSPAAASPARTTDVKTQAPESSGRAVAVVLAGTAAAVSIAIGAYFGLLSQSDASTADGFRQQHPSDFCFQVTSANSAVCKQWNDAVQSQGRDATFSSVFYVAGGVLAAGAVATWLLWPMGSTSASARLMPAVSAGGAGLSAVGHF